MTTTTTTGRSFTVSRRVRKALVGTAVTLAGLTAVVGALHTRAARPLLAMLGVGCPMGHASPDEVQRAHFGVMHAMQGATPAPSRPALGLALDALTFDQAQAWVHARGLRCDERTRGIHLLVCHDVPADAVSEDAASGPIAWLTLGFDTHARLISVDALRTGLPVDRATRVVTDLRAGLDRALGAPTDAAGDPTSPSATAAAVHNASVRYRFRDYVAMLTTLELPRAGVAVREQYLSTAPTL